MLLVKPKTNPGPVGRFANWVTRRRVGRSIEPVRVAGHHPRLLLAMGGFDQALEGRTHSTTGSRRWPTSRRPASSTARSASTSARPRLASWGSGSTSCWLSETIARATSSRRARSWRSTTRRHSAAARWASSDELKRALRSEFGEAELVELNYVIAWENFRARSNSGLGIGPTGFTHESRRAQAELVTAGV